MSVTTSSVLGLDGEDLAAARNAHWSRMSTWMRAGLCHRLRILDWHPENIPAQRELTFTCKTCPVRRQCLTYALETGEHTGVWGGLTERQLRKAASLSPQGTRHLRPGVRINCPWCWSSDVAPAGGHEDRLRCSVCNFDWPGLIDSRLLEDSEDDEAQAS